jgi:hypothetical protein
VKTKGGENFTGMGAEKNEGNKRKRTLNLNWFLSRRLPPPLAKKENKEN